MIRWILSLGVMLLCLTGVALPATAQSGQDAEEEFLKTGTPAMAVRSEKFYQISVEDAEKAVAEALMEEGAGERVTARIIGKRNAPLYESDDPLEVTVKTLKFDETAKRWSANILFASGEEVLSAIPISGRYEEMAEVPVVKERMVAGEEIAEEDIDWIDYPLSRLRKDTVMQAEDLIGRTPRRTISPDRPIRKQELIAPAVVKKDSLVRMQYRTEFMTLETSGQAMDDGGIGDVIRVKNVDSKVVVQAEVEGESTVKVLDIARTEAPRKDRRYDDDR